jgi:hypothetical protein
MKKPMSLDDLRAIKREMEKVGREAKLLMHPMEVAGVLISMYRVAELDSERRALSYALLLFLEGSAWAGSQEGMQ